MKIVFFRPNNRLPDTICTKGNPAKGGNYIFLKELAIGSKKNGLYHNQNKPLFLLIISTISLS